MILGKLQKMMSDEIAKTKTRMSERLRALEESRVVVSLDGVEYRTLDIESRYVDGKHEFVVMATATPLETKPDAAPVAVEVTLTDVPLAPPAVSAEPAVAGGLTPFARTIRAGLNTWPESTA